MPLITQITQHNQLIERLYYRLSGWKGKLLSTAGRETLVKTVLSSQPVYHLTAFPEHKWLVRKIDRLRRSFLWRGETPDKVYGGHSLVNWTTTCRPKNKGGLGVLDLERFARALRLRWLWFQWRHKDRAWIDLDLPCDAHDRELFAASTIVSIGDGKTTSFWTSSWLEGKTAKAMGPKLFQKTRRKKISVFEALKDNRWVAHIAPIHDPEELQEYITVWEYVSAVQLHPGNEDSIRWRWTQNGEYSAKSAYQIQFEGSFSKLKLTPIWRAKSEAKCKFFAWTLLHSKILTANNLAKRNWQNDPICKLCCSEPETPTHLCKDCAFTKQVWSTLIRWLNLTTLNTVDMAGSIHKYWRKCRAKFDKTQKRRLDNIMIYFWWNIWKERNRRTFQQKSLQANQVATLCKDDILQFKLATENPS
jgi:hypothetical protein